MSIRVPGVCVRSAEESACEGPLGGGMGGEKEGRRMGDRGLHDRRKGVAQSTGSPRATSGALVTLQDLAMP